MPDRSQLPVCYGFLGRTRAAKKHTNLLQSQRLPGSGMSTQRGQMALPSLIEIVPLVNPARAEITVPGSKSITNRALVLAALGEGETTLQGALWSEDTQVMVACLQELGFMVNVEADREEPCNRTITVYGKRGLVPPGGTEEQPLELFVGNAGTAARFLAALVCLGKGVYRLHGVPRMHQRPQAALFGALRELGYEIQSANEKLPALIHGAGPRLGTCTVSIAESSQFASALLLCAGTGKWHVTVAGENAEESPYVAMTSKLIAAFPGSEGRFQIEPDASSASYFWAAGYLLSSSEPSPPAQSQRQPFHEPRAEEDGPLSPSEGERVPKAGEGFVHGLKAQTDSGNLLPAKVHAPPPAITLKVGPTTDWQVDSAFSRLLPLPSALSRRTDLGDSIMTAIVLAPFSAHPVRFTDLGRLRVQECERVAALRTELARCGAKVVEEGDTLTVFPSPLHGAGIETYNDHRIAMCFAILGLKIPGIKLKNASCVKKTFPNYFQKLAAPAPRGLGAAILDGKTGRALTEPELFAE